MRWLPLHSPALMKTVGGKHYIALMKTGNDWQYTGIMKTGGGWYYTGTTKKLNVWHNQFHHFQFELDPAVGKTSCNIVVHL